MAVADREALVARMRLRVPRRGIPDAPGAERILDHPSKLALVRRDKVQHRNSCAEPASKFRVDASAGKVDAETTRPRGGNSP